METKKYPQADMERFHNLFLEAGLTLALILTFAAFEWSSPVKKAADLGRIAVQEAETELIPVTRQEQVRPPEPPPPQKVVEILTIVSNDSQIDEELDIEDSEADEETMIDIKPVLNMGREKEDTEENSPVFYVVEEMPEFPGGEMALRQFIANAIKYPVIAQENGIQGKVYVSFVVGKDGQVSDARVLRGVDPSLDKEAIRVVNSLPRWKPGKQQGKTVRVSFSVPISFVLQ